MSLNRDTESAAPTAAPPATYERLMSADAERDFDGVLACYSLQAAVLAPNRPPIAGVRRIELRSLEAIAEGRLDVESGEFRLWWDGDRPLDEGRYPLLWLRTDDGWKMHRDLFNRARPV